MVVLIIVPHVFQTGYAERYVGGTVDQALPNNFWTHPESQSYILGLVKIPSWFIQLAVNLEDNKNHFIIIGTSAPPSSGGFGISVTIKNTNFQDISSTSLNSVHANQYFYVAFKPNGQIIDSGPISPNQTPAGDWGSPKQPTTPNTPDISQIIRDMMDKMVPAMMQMMGMMMMVNMMSSLMQSISKVV
jgi:hypothetical protein